MGLAKYQEIHILDGDLCNLRASRSATLKYPTCGSKSIENYDLVNSGELDFSDSSVQTDAGSDHCFIDGLRYAPLLGCHDQT